MAHATEVFEAQWIKAMFGGDFGDVATGATKVITQFEVGLLRNADAGGDLVCPAEQLDLEINGTGPNTLDEPPASDNYRRKVILNIEGGGLNSYGFEQGATNSIMVNTDDILFDEAGGTDNIGDLAIGEAPVLGAIPASNNGWGAINYIGLWAVGGPANQQLVAYVPIDGRPLTVDDDNSVTIPRGTLQLRLS
jgi:hypothetical protein